MKIERQGDLGTLERHAQGGIVQEIVNKTKVARCTSPTSYHPMYRRKQISLEQFYAADKLRCDYENGIVGFTSYEIKERVQGGKDHEISTRQLDHKRAFYKARASLNLTEKSIILHVIINDKPPTSRTQKSTDNRRKMKEFKQALTTLARHYGYL